MLVNDAVEYMRLAVPVNVDYPYPQEMLDRTARSLPNHPHLLIAMKLGMWCVGGMLVNISFVDMPGRDLLSLVQASEKMCLKWNSRAEEASMAQDLYSEWRKFIDVPMDQRRTARWTRCN